MECARMCLVRVYILNQYCEAHAGLDALLSKVAQMVPMVVLLHCSVAAAPLPQEACCVPQLLCSLCIACIRMELYVSGPSTSL